MLASMNLALLLGFCRYLSHETNGHLASNGPRLGRTASGKCEEPSARVVA